MGSFLDVLATYLELLIFLMANVIFTSLRNIFWILNGTHWHILHSVRPQNYAQSAHVMTILVKRRMQFVQARLMDYVLVHDHFENPDFILQHDDITLLTITPSHAVFVQSKKGSDPAFKANFFILGQFNSADKIITVPLNHLDRLVKNLKDHTKKMVFIQNQSRCGSTLFSRLFLETGRCMVFNEPHVFNAFCKLIYVDEIWTQDEGKNMLRKVVDLLCKPYHGFEEPPLLYVIKPTATSMLATRLTYETFPEATQLFIYREPVQVAISFNRMASALAILNPVLKTSFFSSMYCFWMRTMGLVDRDFIGWKTRHSPQLEIGYNVAATTMKHYQDFRKDGIPIVGFKYEDLVKHPEIITRKLFEVCKMPGELVGAALRALDKDSQEEAVFSQEKLKKVVPNPPRPSEGFLEAARAISKDLGVPGPDGWNEFRLKGTVLPQK